MSCIFMFMLMPVILSMTLMMINHPMLVMMNIILQTIFLCLMLWITSKTSWFSYILFLVFLGGLMVLFIYICSLASNEYFKIKMEAKTIVLLMVFSIFLVYSLVSTQELSSTMMLSKMFSVETLTPTIISMFYLLVTLVIVIKITDFKLGPVRNYKM